MFHRNQWFEKVRFAVVPAALTVLLTASSAAAESKKDEPNNYDAKTFDMVVSAGAKQCLPNATASVTIRPTGQVEIMDVTVKGLPADTAFDFFVIQVPKAPFGVAWYQGDIQTDKHGRGHAQFVGRFNVETFAFAQGTAAAPIVFTNDATTNPPFNPIQMYHLGLWFDSPQAALAAGCPATQTFFNGEHNAGFQVLNTSNFADDHGPLRDVTN
jgi:hypothetical protein